MYNVNVNCMLITSNVYMQLMIYIAMGEAQLISFVSLLLMILKIYCSSSELLVIAVYEA